MNCVRFRTDRGTVSPLGTPNVAVFEPTVPRSFHPYVFRPSTGHNGNAPLDVSRSLSGGFDARRIPFRVAVAACKHLSGGVDTDAGLDAAREVLASGHSDPERDATSIEAAGE